VILPIWARLRKQAAADSIAESVLLKGKPPLGRPLRRHRSPRLEAHMVIARTLVSPFALAALAAPAQAQEHDVPPRG